MNKEILAVYKRRAEEFQGTLPKQEAGAASMLRGYDFQEMVSLIEIVRIGAGILKISKPVRADYAVHVRQDGPVGVDDLVIVTPSSRRHVQIKSGQEPSWESRLVDAVWSDYFTYHADVDRSLTLQICVGSQEAETRMVKNLPSHHLEHTGVEVFHEDLKNLNEPFRDERIRKLMLSMSHVPDHELLLPTMWSDISGAWRKVGRSAEIVDIFDCIDHFSRQTTKSIRRPTELQKSLAAQLSDNIEELSFSADGNKLVVTDLYGETILPVVRGYDWEIVLTRFTGELPKTLDEFEEALGSRKRRKWKGE